MKAFVSTVLSVCLLIAGVTCACELQALPLDLSMGHGEGSHEWNDAITIIENIMWYIEPKIGQQENELAETIKDDLHEALRHGFSCIGLDNKQSDTHIKTLEMCRTLATENAETPTTKTSSPATESSTRSHSGY